MITIFDEIVSALPEQCRKRFEFSDPFSLEVLSAVNTMSEWFAHSRTPFFPHYTDHSSGHSLEVFATALELISEEAWPYISQADLSTLLLSCFLHDCGMHITAKQFAILIRESTQLVPFLDEASWSTLWSNFLQDATRYNQAKLLQIFGSGEPVSRPPEDVSSYTERDFLLAGEFLRQHHPRLAHEMVIGLAERLGIVFPNRISSKLGELAGLIGRSHGMALRDTFSYVEVNFDLRTYQGVHAVYLMGLLRLADYAQLQSARAPEIHHKIHDIPSPLSKREWRVHRSVENIHTEHEDPEALFVQAAPTSVEDFLRLQSWLTDLQRELDITWAVLGEAYGRNTRNGLDHLKLAVRRIRSNLDEANLPFVKEEIRFRVAEAEMLSLLLAPLYGDNPLYGVRELVQNARDAVLERKVVDPAMTEARVDIYAERSDGVYRVAVVDNGIGMTLDVLRDYFLNAGASYRYNLNWREIFETSEGKSKVQRSGRFGVGALASFLLGNTISVATRNVGEADGLVFTCNLHSSAIEIRRSRIPVGTRIEVESSEPVYDLLKRSDEQIIEAFQFDDQVTVTFHLPPLDDAASDRQINCSGYTYGEEEVWNFSTENYPLVRVLEGVRGRKNPDYVNGIVIDTLSEDEPQRYDRRSIYRNLQLFKLPRIIADGYLMSREHFGTRFAFSIRVTDPDGATPLNLARTSFSSNDKQITAEINQRLLADTISYVHQNYDWLAGEADKEDDSVRTVAGNRGVFIWNKAGVMPADTTLLKAANLTAVAAVVDVASITDALLAKFPKVGFLGSALKPRTGSMLAEYLRRKSEMIHAGACRSIRLVFLRSDLAVLDTIQSASRWMHDAAQNGDRRLIRGVEYTIITLGEHLAELDSLMAATFQGAESDVYEFYVSTDGEFSRPTYYERDYYRPAALATGWLETVGTFASRSKLGKLARTTKKAKLMFPT